MDTKKLYIGIAITIILLLIILKMDTIKNAVWDLISENRIKNLHPAIRDKAREFLHKAEQAGIKLRVNDGYRTYEEQDNIYAKGRTRVNPDGKTAKKPLGNIVTNARAGQSLHNFGLAIDVVPMVNGNADWNTKQWNKIGAIGESLGFKWGGGWKSLIDKPHFQMTFGNSLAQLRSKHDGNGYVLV